MRTMTPLLDACRRRRVRRACRGRTGLPPISLRTRPFHDGRACRRRGGRPMRRGRPSPPRQGERALYRRSRRDAGLPAPGHRPRNARRGCSRSAGRLAAGKPGSARSPTMCRRAALYECAGSRMGQRRSSSCMCISFRIGRSLPPSSSSLRNGGYACACCASGGAVLAFCRSVQSVQPVAALHLDQPRGGALELEGLVRRAAV